MTGDADASSLLRRFSLLLDELERLSPGSQCLVIQAVRDRLVEAFRSARAREAEERRKGAIVIHVGGQRSKEAEAEGPPPEKRAKKGKEEEFKRPQEPPKEGRAGPSGVKKKKAKSASSKSLLKPKQLQQCKACDDFASESASELLRHYESSHPDLPVCAKCLRVCASAVALVVHRKTAHPEASESGSEPASEAGPLRCDLCAYETACPDRLRHHLRHSHASGTCGPFDCGVCGRAIFGGRRVFQNHLKLHAGDLDHPCVHCGKAFVSAERLRAHVAGKEGWRSPKADGR